MTIPVWVQQEAIEAYIQQEEAFQQFLAELDATLNEVYYVPFTRRARRPRRYVAY